MLRRKWRRRWELTRRFWGWWGDYRRTRGVITPSTPARTSWITARWILLIPPPLTSSSDAPIITPSGSFIRWPLRHSSFTFTLPLFLLTHFPISCHRSIPLINLPPISSSEFAVINALQCLPSASCYFPLGPRLQNYCTLDNNLPLSLHFFLFKACWKFVRILLEELAVFKAWYVWFLDYSGISFLFQLVNCFSCPVWFLKLSCIMMFLIFSLVNTKLKFVSIFGYML